MRFNSISIINYGLFKGEHSFILDNRGLQFIVGKNKDGTRANSNGAGKSTLFEALEWCLFGEIPKSDAVDSIINRSTGKDCNVSVFLTDDEEKDIIIRRFRKCGKVNGVSLMVGSEDRTTLDTSETQKIIERILGLTRDIYHAAVFFSQTGTWKFADKINSDVESMEILTKILQLEEIDIWLDKAKADKKVIDSETEKLIMQISGLSNQICILSTMNFDQKIIEFEDNRKSKITNTLKICAAKIVEAQTLEAKIINTSVLEKQLIELEKTPIEHIPPPIELNTINQQIGISTNQLDNYRTKYNELLKTIDDLTSNIVTKCRLCGQTITKQLAPEHVAKLTIEANDIKQQSITLKNNINSVLEKKTQLNALYLKQQDDNRQQQKEYNLKLSEIKDQIHLNVQTLQQINNLRKESNNLYGDCERLKNDVNLYISEKDRITKEIGRINEILNETDTLLRALKSEQEVYCFWIEAFGIKGLKSFILDSKLDILTQAANEYIGLLTDNRFYIKFETQTPDKKGKQRNKLQMRVFQRDNNNVEIEHNYVSWSGGEKARISLGVDLGLSNLIASRSKKKYNILILDEVFKHLDHEGQNAVVEMLHKLSTEKSSIFVIDHSETMQSNFENIIVVERINGCSKIIE